ncbi:PepSY domain-containing protein [Bacillus sp. B15-48]|uniref:PepSY domain-containing protein n=1 Tax=Bacillus sp. B15-48 TaxID=1548601 RepID=UPI00193F748C|nr:PepSY domain-containing protein [Bacillus sp. B15-48]MBM4760783.1 hypothetical protein [Bacillus sp. B15-48]
MKRNIGIMIVAGVVLLGGALGVGAFADSNKDLNSQLTDNGTAQIVQGLNMDVRELEANKDVVFEQEGKKIDDDDDEVKFETVSAKLINSNATKTKNEDDKKAQRITKAEAIAIATKETPGTVVEVEYDDGEYEIEIRTATHEVEYEIDAGTGGILEKEIEKLEADDHKDD